MPASTSKPSKTQRQAIADHAPWLPTKVEPADIRALQALHRGEADPIAQKRALEWILLCTGIRDLSYRPGEDGRRDTDFAEGKRFVGLQIAKHIYAQLSLRRDNAEQPR